MPSRELGPRPCLWSETEAFSRPGGVPASVQQVHTLRLRACVLSRASLFAICPVARQAPLSSDKNRRSVENPWTLAPVVRRHLAAAFILSLPLATGKFLKGWDFISGPETEF